MANSQMTLSGGAVQAALRPEVKVVRKALVDRCTWTDILRILEEHGFGTRPEKERAEL